MSQLHLKPSQLKSGVLIAPPSKSHTLRALCFATLASGVSRIQNPLHSPDTDAMMAVCRGFGATVTQTDDQLIVEGVAGKPLAQTDHLDVGNSGLALRFAITLAALQAQPVTITGDESICTRRHIEPLLGALRASGVTCDCHDKPNHAPVTIQGSFNPQAPITIEGQDSQNVTALIILSVFADVAQPIQVINAGEIPYIDMTIEWLKRLGMDISGYDKSTWQLQFTGQASIDAFDYSVPGDYSQAAYLVVAHLLAGSGQLIIQNLPSESDQADAALIPFLQELGAKIEIQDNSIIIDALNEPLPGFKLDANYMIDQVPLLAVLACFASTQSSIHGVGVARLKECDRVAAIVTELQKMGGKLNDTEDGLEIEPAILQGAIVDSHQDHRMVMSLAVAALLAEGNTTIDDWTCVRKTYLCFVDDMQNLGAKLWVS